jgi:hypothetical protein
MKRAACIAILLLVAAACGGRSSQMLVEPYIFLHDNSSKVWLVEKLAQGNRDYTPLKFENRQMIIFHENHRAYFYRISEFGKKGGIRSNFWMDKSRNEFGFQIGKKLLLFDIVSMSRTRLVLDPKNGSYPYRIVLVPFPEY